MSTPDVRVRLSPEGVKEVVFALREIQKEAKKSNAESTKGLGSLRDAARDLKSLLPTIGLAAAVAGFLGLSKAALDTADNTGKLQTRIGGTVEDISALTLAFRTNESNQDGLQSALVKTANVIGEVRAGSADAIKAIAAIGVNVEQFKSLDTPRAFEAVAQALVKIPPGAQRAAAAQQIFGKQAGDLLVALDAVGTQGIDPFIAKARQLGVLIDSDLAQAAARAKDSLGLIRIQAEGLATQFISGLAPAVANAMESFSKAITGDGINGMRTFGEIVGTVIKGVTFFFVALGKSVGATAAKVVSFAEQTGDVLKALAHGDLQAAMTAAERGAAERLSIEQSYQEDLADMRKEFNAKPAPAPKPGGGGADATLAPPDPKLIAARREALKAALAGELKITQEQLKAADEANKVAYETGLVSLATFMDRRRAIIQKGADAEIAALKGERAALAQELSAANTDPTKSEADKIKLRQQLASLNTDIQAKEIAAARELAGVNADQEKEQIKIGQERQALDAKLAELEGNRSAAFKQNLADEIRGITELGQKAGQSVDEIQSNVARLTAARTAAFNFDEVAKKGQDALAAFNRDADQIHRDQDAGIISQLEGERRLIELEGQRLVVLQQLAAQALLAAQATNDPEQIRKAQEYAASVDQIAASYKGATDFALQLKNAGIDALQGGIEDFLVNLKDIKGAGDAFKSLASSIVQSLNKVAAEILAKQATFAILKALGFSTGAGGAAGSVAGAVAGGYRGGRVRGYQGGGDVVGPRLNIPGPDKIPMLGQAGEFMVRRSVAQAPGVLAFLRGLNNGQYSLAQAMRGPRYATGGEIGAPSTSSAAPGGQRAAGGDAFNLRLVNVVSPDMVTDAMSSPAGEKVILNVLERNTAKLQRLSGTKR